jgi:hypothetical protein
MVVAMFNAVKVESVPLNFGFFSRRRVESAWKQSSVRLDQWAVALVYRDRGCSPG